MLWLNLQRTKCSEYDSWMEWSSHFVPMMRDMQAMRLTDSEEFYPMIRTISLTADMVIGYSGDRKSGPVKLNLCGRVLSFSLKSVVV